MAIEIERKFLVKSDDWRRDAVGVAYRQGYLSTERGRTVRVRIGGDKAFITVKGPAGNAARDEFEYPIPLEDAEQILDRLCHRPLIEKLRYKIPGKGVTWEVDEFQGENAGLIIAEVELQRADQPVKLPAWIGREVTEDSRYANASLVRNPYRRWGKR
jgi:CYTH domain-containing protein